MCTVVTIFSALLFTENSALVISIYNETDTTTFIARHKNNTIEPVQKIFDNISFYNWYYSYRCPNANGQNEFLKFRTQDEQMFGLLEIIDYEIYLNYFINKALLEPKYVGAERADRIIVNRLNTIIPRFRNLELSTIDSKEQIWGSFDITPNHNIGVGNSWNPKNYTIDTCRSYLMKEDSIFSNSIMYYGTKENNLVRIVTIDWDYERNLLKLDSELHAKKTFDNKTDFLIDYITENVGKLIENMDEKDFIKRTWETPTGIKLYLSYNRKYYGVRLVIYDK